VRILHTADWHLGDSIGPRRIDRTRDLQRAVETIADMCKSERIDVLLIAGDLFSDKCNRQDDLSAVIAHLSDTFGPFMREGGTIVACTGNHDREVPCQTLKHTLTLADPREMHTGDLVSVGRFYLANRPLFLRLPDRAGGEVQFTLLPYPTPACYNEPSDSMRATREERNRTLSTRLAERRRKLTESAAFRHDLPTVLAAHLHVRGANPHKLFQITEDQDVVFNPADLPAGFAYTALGHIHQAQSLGEEHVRYSGSIERLDLGERDDQKSVTVFEVGRTGLVGKPQLLPLEATPFFDIDIDDPAAQIPNLRAQYPEHDDALVKYRLQYEPGEPQRDAWLRELDEIFPRCYDRELIRRGDTSHPMGDARLPADDGSPEHVVLHFLENELLADPDRDALLALARGLLEETRA
jgi:exonuclease SbcD